MNFLAHAWLARSSNELIFGGLIADFVKGRLTNQFPVTIKEGILLHRRIDKFCDHHPTSFQFRESLPNGTRRFAGIILDIAYDHLLARDWQQYNATPLDQFAQSTYRVIESFDEYLPENSKVVMSRMIERDWFSRYQNIDTLKTALEYTAKRFSKGEALLEYTQSIETELKEIERLFSQFWPEIIRADLRQEPLQ